MARTHHNKLTALLAPEKPTPAIIVRVLGALGLAGIDRVLRDGHATRALTDHGTHVLAEAHLEAAETVTRLVEEAGA